MEAGTGRSRAGNTMARTRVALLAGARQCVLTRGSKATTMVDIAVTAGIAKATLYNHFRTKSEVFAALVDHEITAAAEEMNALAATVGVRPALCQLAERVGAHPVARGLAVNEPRVLASLVCPEQAGMGSPSWETARTSLAGVLGDDGAVEFMLRYLVSQLLWPAPRGEIESAIGAILTTVAPPAGRDSAVPGLESGVPALDSAVPAHDLATAASPAPGSLASSDREGRLADSGEDQRRVRANGEDGF